MRIKSPMPKSSFLSMEKDLNLIINRMLSNERLKKLLYYNTPDALMKQNLSDAQTYQLIGKNIKKVPKLTIDNTVLNYIIISFKDFLTNPTNPEFRNNTIEFDIVCHFDQWQLNDLQLRPYKIAAEIDSMLSDDNKLTGIGEVEFLGATQTVLTDEFGAVCLLYKAYHGGEDHKHMTTPEQEEQFLRDFEKSIQNRR